MAILTSSVGSRNAYGETAVAPGEHARREPLSDGTLGHQQLEHSPEYATIGKRSTIWHNSPSNPRRREKIGRSSRGTVKTYCR